MKYIIFPGNDDVFFNMFDKYSYSDKYNVVVEQQVYRKHCALFTMILNKLSFHDNLLFLNRIIKIIAYPFLCESLLKARNNKNVCLVFSNITFKLLPTMLIKKYLYDKINVVVYLLDNSKQPLCKETVKICKKLNLRNVYTFDKGDANKYGFKHFYYIYSVKNDLKNVERKFDVCFFGSDKGRLSALLDIYNRFEQNGLHTNFNIIGVEDIPQNVHSVNFNKPIPYLDMIDEIQESNCLLDYVIEEQSGMSFRIAEAVCYNKKLITNNNSIFDFPFYNPKYMSYFESVDDIDINFVRSSENVQYNYNNEFSPEKFLEKIEMDLQE